MRKVIECKDCKFFIEAGEQTACKLSEDPHLPVYMYHPKRDDYCSRGEKWKPLHGEGK